MILSMKRLLTIGALGVVALFTTSASAQQSIGTYSGCKKLGASAKAACLQCVGSGGGNFYQVASKTCGMAPGMKPSKPAASEPPPARPKAMPKSGAQYVTIPAGTFRIGANPDEDGASDKETFDATVTISRPFLMKTTEVTQGEWHFVMGDPPPYYEKGCGLDCPAGGVTWLRALDYLNALSKREGLEECYAVTGPKPVWTKGLSCTGYRLPTEAEWEWAARGKTTSARYGEPDAIGWHSDNSDGKRHAVGQKAANAYGLYDMLGSQWEWTWDVEDYSQKPFSGRMTDPITGGLTGAKDGNRIVRGGSFNDSRVYMRAAHRYQYLTDSGGTSYGFRPVRTIAPVTKK